MSAPFAGSRFRLQIEGMADTGALAVALPEARIVTVARRPPVVELGTLTLRRGLSGSSEWYRWWDESRRSKRKAARTVIVLLLDGAGDAVLRWSYRGARPSGYAVSGLDALISAVLVETLELSVAAFEAKFG